MNNKVQKGTSPATLDGYVTYIINGEPVVGMTAEIESINKSVQTDQEGFYDFGSLKGGNTYTVKYILDGEVKDTSRLLLKWEQVRAKMLR